MRFQWTFGGVFVLSTLIVCGQLNAAPSRLVALTDRQDLRDMVCYAMADGSVSTTERRLILEDAKQILSPEEYVSFKKAFDRIAPPKKSPPKSKQFAKTSRKKTPTSPTKPASTVETGPVIPTGAILPDRIAQPVLFR
jgi:hypothetical protein